MSPRAKSNEPPVECCRVWMGVPVELRAQWHWQVLHRFAHSRTTFTPTTLALIARVPLGTADELIKSGQDREWIWTPQPGIYVGSLTNKR